MSGQISIFLLASSLLASGIAWSVEDGTSMRTARLLNMSSPGRVPGKFLVQFRKEAQLGMVPLFGSQKPSVAPNVLPITEANTRELAAALGNMAGGQVTNVYARKRKGFAVRGLSDSAVEELAKDPRIDYIEPALKVSLSSITTQGSPPTDPAPWHLDRIDQRQLPLNGTYSFNANGAGIHVYVMDTGVWLTHSQFQGRAGTSEWDCVAPNGFDQNCRSRGPSDGQLDCKGHGTQVASLIGGTTYGVAKGVQLRSFIITHSAHDGLNCNDLGDSADFISALDQIEDEAQNASDTIVVNISAILTDVSTMVEDHIRGVINDGAIFVVGAGNNGSNACNYTPSRMPEVITVGATTRADEMRSASNGGTCVDILAPGSDMIAANRGGNFDTISGIQGTSFATPIVSGIVAIYLQSHPQAQWDQVRDAIRAEATSGVLTNLSSGTPNLLAYNLVAGGSGTGTGTPPANVRQVISIITHMLLSD